MVQTRRGLQRSVLSPSLQLRASLQRERCHSGVSGDGVGDESEHGRGWHEILGREVEYLYQLLSGGIPIWISSTRGKETELERSATRGLKRMTSFEEDGHSCLRVRLLSDKGRAWGRGILLFNVMN